MGLAVFVDLLDLFWDQHGIYSLSAVLKRDGFDTRYVASRSPARALKRVLELKPDFVLYSCFSTTVPNAIAFDRMLKSVMPHVVSVIGGPGVTYDHGAIDESTIDAYCVGEGEIALPAFLQSGLPGGNIVRRGERASGGFNQLIDPNSLPLADRSVIYDVDSLLANAPSKQFLSGRGCPYRCTYCMNHAFNEMFSKKGKIVRKKSVDYLIEEVKSIKARYPLHTVIFNDDTFILDRKWMDEFFSRFPSEAGLAYTCNIRANLMTEDIARGLSASGCANVNWSIEAGNDHLRNEVLKRKMTLEQIQGAADLLHKHAIPFRIGNIIGLPGETEAMARQTLEVNISARPTMGLANIFVPFPGVELTEYAVTGGYYNPGNMVPKDYFTASVLEFDDAYKVFIYKLMCLFPVFISWPALYRNAFIQAVLLALPRIVLRFIYEAIYTTRMARFYSGQTPLRQKARMAIRYLRNL
ncbi:MAG: radical SAM protein [Phaeospirillum sp.]|nr:radical SAM protein [Phaeospirillum sp.]